jgi:hypothetical protein
VFALYGLLELIGQPSFYDKLLCVPLLNLSVRAIERATRSHWLERWHGQNLGLALEPARRNFVYMAVWITLFATAYSMNILDKHHPGARSAFWRDACTKDLRNACRSLSTLLVTSCGAGSVDDCNELGVLLVEKAGTPAARREALRAFESACNLGNDAACANAAIEQLFHESDARISDALLQRLAGACAGSDGRACYLHGYARETGRAPPADPLAARSDYARGCEAGWTAACSAGGKLELRGANGAPTRHGQPRASTGPVSNPTRRAARAARPDLQERRRHPASRRATRKTCSIAPAISVSPRHARHSGPSNPEKAGLE